jgi:sensor histidine kinase YesM
MVDVELTSEPYSLRIPPFLLQPFLENSIKHGFDDSQIAGHIDVRYTEDKESITCVITDNGMGREAAKKKTISNHTSHGVEIAFECVDLFNRPLDFIGEE